MDDQALKARCIEILKKQKEKDPKIGLAWSGDAADIEVVACHTVRSRTVSIRACYRDTKTERTPATKPSGAKSQPSAIDLWRDYKASEWLGSSWDWTPVDEFWEECPTCKNQKKACHLCDGSGRIVCGRCYGSCVE